MKSHLQIAEMNEPSITFKDITYTTTKKDIVVTLDNKNYHISKQQIHQQQFSLAELYNFLDYLIFKSEQYLTITAPQDGVIKLEAW